MASARIPVQPSDVQFFFFSLLGLFLLDAMLLRRATGHFVRFSNLVLFSGLISYIVVALRFLLGATEGSVTACMQLFFYRILHILTHLLAVMLVCNMFYNRTEIGERIGWSVPHDLILTIQLNCSLKDIPMQRRCSDLLVPSLLWRLPRQGQYDAQPVAMAHDC